MKATFENSVDVLVKAYLNDQLVHGDCQACAVGNLVASAMGCKPREKDTGLWFNVVIFINYSGAPEEHHQVEITNYSVEQLRRIEEAFESAWMEGPDDDAEMFNGLLAVVDVLADIHGVDLTVKQNAIGRFEEVHAAK